MGKRLTLRDLARELGVSHVAVSLALRDDPRIPAATRKRIQDVAQKRGYRRDPHLASMAAYLRQTREHPQGSALAILDLSLSKSGMTPYHRRLREGIKAQADEFGYVVDNFSVQRDRLTGGRLGQVLRSRGISGVVVLPPTRAWSHFRLPWQSFASVAICESLPRPEIDRVGHNHFSGMLTALNLLRSSGYRRIGFYSTVDQNRRVEYRWLAAYLLHSHRQVRPVSIPPLIVPTYGEKQLVAWVKHHRIDAVVSSHSEPYEILQKFFPVPDKIGYACLDWTPEHPECAGIDQEPENLGRVAVDILVQKLNMHRLGVPKKAMRLLYTGVWRDSGTVRRTKPYLSRVRRLEAEPRLRAKSGKSDDALI